MNTKSARLKLITKEELVKLISEVSSKNELMNILGVSSTSSHYLKIIDGLLFKYNINNMRFGISKVNTINNSGFVENSITARSVIRRQVIKHKLIEYKCSGCPIVDEYNGKPISLQLDHINGIRNDHRLVNLRWICPNCHSQTTTYAGKSRFIKNKTICDCGKTINNNTKSGKCKKCATTSRVNARKFEVDIELLRSLVLTHTIESIGRMFGVSGNAIRKRCKRANIEYKLNKLIK